jgi:hypothetical protein
MPASRPAYQEDRHPSEVDHGPAVDVEQALDHDDSRNNNNNSLWEAAIDGVDMVHGGAGGGGGGGADSYTSSDDDDENGDDPMSVEFRTMMHRVRCMFGALTFPIPPLAAAVVLTMFYFLGVAYLPFEVKAFTALWNGMDAADFPDLPTCAHPLYPYSAATVVAFAYAMRHDAVRTRFFTNDRARRLYDKCVQGMALFYVYMGILLKQTCTDDVPPGQTVDSCVATCPHVTAAFSLYVLALECFSVAIFVPLLLLPCVYVWFVRRGTHRQLTTARSSPPRGASTGTISAATTTITSRRMQRVLDGLAAIQVVANADSTASPLTAILTGSNGNDDDGERIPLQNKECCICMADLTDANVVRIKNCGHVFHKECLSHWVRRRRTTCPLCRADIRRHYGTFGGSSLGHVEP